MIESSDEDASLKFINQKDSHGQTPLQIALNNEHVENAKILINSGADIDIKYDCIIIYSIKAPGPAFDSSLSLTYLRSLLVCEYRH